jgi:hypothetical protein
MMYTAPTLVTERHKLMEETWETPSFVEIEMNAEIGSYQQDQDPDYFGI